jgi:hypothetical protein
VLRKVLNPLSPVEAMELLIDKGLDDRRPRVLTKRAFRRGALPRDEGTLREVAVNLMDTAAASGGTSRRTLVDSAALNSVASRPGRRAGHRRASKAARSTINASTRAFASSRR